MTTRNPPAGSSFTGFERAEWFQREHMLVPPLGAALPVMDGLALLLGVVGVGQSGPVGFTYAILALALVAGGGAGGGRINPRLSDDLPKLLGLLVLPLLLLAPFFDSSELGAFVVVLPPIVLFVLAARGAMYWLMRAARARELIVEPTLIVGIGRLGLKIADTLCDHPEFGLRPVGFLGRSRRDPRSARRPRELGAVDLPLPLLGPVTRLARIAREHRVRRVIIAFDYTSEQEMIPILREAGRLPFEIYVMPRFFELGVAPEGSTTEDVWGIPLIRLRRLALRSFAWRTKRVFDLVLAGALLVLTAPIMIVAVIAVAATSPGPVFFRQVRVGQRSELFELLKLRTLYLNGDGDTTWTTTSGDSRVTPVGRILRRTCIDELPQLINVLRGQMSLVGPRPERPYFADGFREEIKGYGDRQRVPAGVTGWAQVHGLRGDTSITERALFDNHYVEHWSLWRDAVIIARTIGTVLRGGGH